MLMGRIKTQKLDEKTQLFEIVHLLHNGLELLVLEEQKN